MKHSSSPGHLYLKNQKEARPYLSRWSWCRRWGSSLSRGRLRSPNQILEPAEHGVARCGLQRGLLVHDCSWGTFPMWVSGPEKSPRILCSPRLACKEQTEAIKFLKPLIPSGHSPLYWSQQQICCPLVLLTPVQNTGHFEGLMTLSVIGNTIMNTSVPF